MATNNLTPELLAMLSRTVTPTNAGTYYDQQLQRAYTPTWSDVGGTGTGEAYSPNSQITGWTTYDGPLDGDVGMAALNGRQYNNYDANGNFTGEGTFSGLGRSGVSKFIDAGGVAALLAAPFAAAMFPALGAAASFGTNPVLSGASASGFAPGVAGAAGGMGAAGSVAGDAFLPGQLGVNGANLSASIPGTSFMNSSGLNTLLEGAGMTGTGQVAGDAYLPGQLGVDGANMSTAALPGTSFMNASGINTLLDKAGLSGAAKAAGGGSSLLGLGATALGALAGAKGQDASQTSVKSMDPRMDKLFYEDLAPRVQGLLAKQMAPGAMQGFTDMQSVGRNLLNQPVAGNGFNRFFPGR